MADLLDDLQDPTIVFVRSPGRAATIANGLADRQPSPLNPLPDASRWLDGRFGAGWHFSRAVRHGLGVHHGRIPTPLSRYAVRMFNEGVLNPLICTSTLIEGVNTAARNIVLFDHQIGRRGIDLFTHNNIKGRSGRMMKYLVGHVYLFHDEPGGELPTLSVPALSPGSGSPLSLLMDMPE